MRAGSGAGEAIGGTRGSGQGQSPSGGSIPGVAECKTGEGERTALPSTEEGRMSSTSQEAKSSSSEEEGLAGMRLSRTRAETEEAREPEVFTMARRAGRSKPLKLNKGRNLSNRKRVITEGSEGSLERGGGP